jgi:RNA polymerase sigma-70 factor, ECF subfamily
MTGRKHPEQHAFEHQALAHTDALYHFGMRLTGSADAAGDLVQETYVKALRFWSNYDGRTHIRAWLFRIMKNAFIDLYRKESREPDVVDYCETMRPSSLHDVSAGANTHDDPIFDNLLDDVVAEAVSGLPESFRTAVILCDIERLSYQEVASILGCPIGTVRSRLHRGRGLLRSKLQSYAMKRGHVRRTTDSVEIQQSVLKM